MEEPTSRSFNYSSRCFFYVINRIGRTYTEEETGNSANEDWDNAVVQNPFSAHHSILIKAYP